MCISGLLGLALALHPLAFRGRKALTECSWVWLDRGGLRIWNDSTQAFGNPSIGIVVVARGSETDEGMLRGSDAIR